MSLATAAASTGPSTVLLGHFAMGGLIDPGSQRWLDGSSIADADIALGLIFGLVDDMRSSGSSAGG